MKKYKTIKELVFDEVRRTKGLIDFDTLTLKVKRSFPNSKWKKTHWAWYRNKIKDGRFKKEFTKEERANLLPAKEDVTINENDIKRIGDKTLDHVRFILNEFSGGDVNLRFKLNRWVFARLMIDERKQKAPIKKQLWETGNKKCADCKKPFETLKGVEIHRKDASLAYSLPNCALLCRKCHQNILG